MENNLVLRACHLLLFLICVRASPDVDDHDKWVSKYRGFICEHNIMTHFGPETTRFEFVKDRADSTGKPFLKAIYTPQYRLNTEKPAPQLISKNFSIGWLPRDDPRILESIAYDDLVDVSQDMKQTRCKKFFRMSTKVVSETFSHIGDSVTVTTDFIITIQHFCSKHGGFTEIKSDFKKYSFHPDHCKIVP